jgi:hypothetical protein
VSSSCNPNFHALGAHYLNADTSAFMQFIEGDLFERFPTLRLVIPHGGGAVPYHWGRYRGLAMRMGRPDPSTLLRNVFFDTCVYHQPGIDLLTRRCSAPSAARTRRPGSSGTTPSATSTRPAWTRSSRRRCSRATRGACTRAWTPD